MKLKQILLILSFLMAGLVFSGCGSDSNSDSASASGSPFLVLESGCGETACI